MGDWLASERYNLVARQFIARLIKMPFVLRIPSGLAWLAGCQAAVATRGCRVSASGSDDMVCLPKTSPLHALERHGSTEPGLEEAHPRDMDMTGPPSVWAMARRKPNDYRREATRCSGVRSFFSMLVRGLG